MPRQPPLVDPEPSKQSQARVALPGELWGLATYFNPASYATKLINLRRFSESARNQGLKLLIVELAGTGRPFAVSEDLADRFVGVRSDAVMWHKERLFNLGLRELPAACDKVAWLDADVVFENPDWVSSTSDLLESHPVVQPFSIAAWLRRGEDWASLDAMSPGIGEGRWLPSMGYAMARKKVSRETLENYWAHGHTGFAWAARRALLDRHGFYDRMILGGADLLMARAMYSPEDPDACSAHSSVLAADLDAWRRAFYADVQGNVGCVEGRVLHLWHGNVTERRYQDRFEVLASLSFDPRADVLEGEDGCLAWAREKPELQHEVRAYFAARKEDG